jgi:hypothetical protein
MPPAHVHFNGNVNLADAESVMREIVARVSSSVRRIPDGETGDRGNWVFFQMQKFLQLPWLVFRGAAAGGCRRAWRCKPVTSPAGRPAAVGHPP